MATIDITTLSALSALVGAELAHLNKTAHPKGATVLGLVGDLGAGKTTFVQELALRLGVKEVVTSPTYLIMRSYATTNATFKTLVHIDAYRIESLAELAPLRFAEVLGSPDTLVCIEWADRIKDALPATTRWLLFSLTSDGIRQVSKPD